MDADRAQREALSSLRAVFVLKRQRSPTISLLPSCLFSTCSDSRFARRQSSLPKSLPFRPFVKLVPGEELVSPVCSRSVHFERYLASVVSRSERDKLTRHGPELLEGGLIVLVLKKNHSQGRAHTLQRKLNPPPQLEKLQTQRNTAT